MEEDTLEDKTEENQTGIIRNKLGMFVPGVSGNPDGRPLDTPEKKIERKAVKKIIEEYKELLAEALPDIAPILKAKALEGDVPAIKEIHERVMGKAHQTTDVTSGGEKLTNETQSLANIAIARFLNGTPPDTTEQPEE